MSIFREKNENPPLTPPQRLFTAATAVGDLEQITPYLIGSGDATEMWIGAHTFLVAEGVWEIHGLTPLTQSTRTEVYRSAWGYSLRDDEFHLQAFGEGDEDGSVEIAFRWSDIHEGIRRVDVTLLLGNRYIDMDEYYADPDPDVDMSEFEVEGAIGHFCSFLILPESPISDTALMQAIINGVIRDVEQIREELAVIWYATYAIESGNVPEGNDSSSVAEESGLVAWGTQSVPQGVEVIFPLPSDAPVVIPNRSA
jgi:hypothetical protein